MGGTERIDLPSVPLRLAVIFAIFYLHFGLLSLGARAVLGLSAGGVVLSITCFVAAVGSLVPYWVKVVVTAEGVTHRPLFRIRQVPWHEIYKVDQTTRLMVPHIAFYTAKKIVTAAPPSESEHQRILAMHKAQR